MITLNNTEYNLCLLDTNVISEMIKNPKREFANFLSQFLGQQCIPCFSIFTILELKNSRELLNPFLVYFSKLPCVILKSHEQLLAEEVSNYEKEGNINPILIASTPIKPPFLNNIIEGTFKNSKNQQMVSYWLDGRNEALEGMLSLRSNFQPKNKKYTKNDIDFFIFSTVTTQLILRAKEFSKSYIKNGSAIDINQFPSLKASLYTVFYKFYSDFNRKPLRSDVFDIIISSALPYVDIILTERHLVEVIRRTQLHDSFIENLKALPLETLR